MQCVDLGGRRIIKKNFFKQKTAYEISECLVGSEMCIRDRLWSPPVSSCQSAACWSMAAIRGFSLSLIHI